MAYKIAPMTPLKGSFMIMSIVGFLISVIWAYPRWPDYGFSFVIVFLAMFIASIISMTHSDSGGELQIDAKRSATVVKTAIRGKTIRKKSVKKKKKKPKKASKKKGVKRKKAGKKKKK